MRRSRTWTAAFVAIVLVAVLILALPDRDEGRSPDSKLTIEGIVLAKDGSTPVQAYVRAFFPDGPLDPRHLKNIGASTFTNKEGRFRLKGLLPGSYRLVANHFSGGMPTAEYGMPGEPQVVEAGTKDVQIRLIDGGWIGLKLRDGVTARRITDDVTATRYLPGGEARDEPVNHLVTHVFGRAAIRLLPGEEKRVRVFAESYLPSELLILRMPPGLVQHQLRVKLQPDPAACVTLRLRVLEPSGKPAERVRILDAGAPNVRLDDVAVTHLSDGWAELLLPGCGHELMILDATVGSDNYARPWLTRVTLGTARGKRWIDETVSLRIGGWIRVPPDSGFDQPRRMRPSAASTHFWLEQESGWWVALAHAGQVMIGGKVEIGRRALFVGVKVRAGETTEFIPLRHLGFGGG